MILKYKFRAKNSHQIYNTMINGTLGCEKEMRPDTAKICCPKTDILLPLKIESAFFLLLKKFWSKFNEFIVVIPVLMILQRFGSFLLNLPHSSSKFNSLPPPTHEEANSSDWLKFTLAWVETLRRLLFRISIMVWGELNQFYRKKKYLLHCQIYWRSAGKGRGGGRVAQKYYIRFLNNPAPPLFFKSPLLRQSLRTHCQNLITV